MHHNFHNSDCKGILKSYLQALNKYICVKILYMIDRFNVGLHFHLNNDQHIYNQIWKMLKLKALGDAQEPMGFC